MATHQSGPPRREIVVQAPFAARLVGPDATSVVRRVAVPPTAGPEVARYESRPAQRVRGARPTGAGVAAIVTTVLAVWLLRIANDPVMAAVVGVTVGTASVVGLVWAAVEVRRARVTATVDDTDARVGDDVEITITVDRPAVTVRALDPAGAVIGNEAGHVLVARPAVRRGWFPAVRLEVRSSAPLGLVTVSRSVVAPLPRPLHVAPAAWPHPVAPSTATGEGAEPGHGRTGVGTDELRSVRPYVPGDPARMVHWPTSAHAGELLVREWEPPIRRRVAVVVDLTGAWADAESVTSYAEAVVAGEVADGAEVLLLTNERGLPVGRPVAGPLDVRRRLARAAPGPVGAVPAGVATRDVVAEHRARGQT